MKKGFWLFVFAFCLLPLGPCFGADLGKWNGTADTALGKWNGGTWGTASGNITKWNGLTAASGEIPTYLLSESFNKATDPLLCATGYSTNCDNTWTVDAGTPDFDYSAGTIEGTNSLYLSALTNGASITIRKSLLLPLGRHKKPISR